MTRNGKIARLPKSVRDKLNRRLNDGEQGKKLVEWLNGLPEVSDILEVEFDSRPVTEQNLSEWKKGGYQDWLRAQESQDFARGLSEEAEDVEAMAGDVSMADRLSTMLTLTMGKLLSELKIKAAKNTRARRDLLEMVEALVSLRRSDQTSARLRMKQQWHDRELKAAQDKDPSFQDRVMKVMRKKEMEPLHDFAHAIYKEQYFQHLVKTGGVKPERVQAVRELLGMSKGAPKSNVSEQEVKDDDSASLGSNPTESESIRPNPTKAKPEG